MTVFRTATLRTFFFAIHAGAKELNNFLGYRLGCWTKGSLKTYGIDSFGYAHELMLCLHVFRQTGSLLWADCLAPPPICFPYKDRGIPLSALPKHTTSKFAGKLMVPVVMTR